MSGAGSGFGIGFRVPAPPGSGRHGHPRVALTDSTTYQYKVRTFDGTYASACTAWGSWYTFKADTTVPSAVPSVSSTDFTSGAWSATNSGTITFGNGGVTDLNGYWRGRSGGALPRNGLFVARLPSPWVGERRLPCQSLEGVVLGSTCCRKVHTGCLPVAMSLRWSGVSRTSVVGGWASLR